MVTKRPLPKLNKPEVDEPEIKEFATPTQLRILRESLEAGTLSTKGITRPLFLNPFQSRELGFEIEEGEFLRIEPRATGEEPTLRLVTPEGVSDAVGFPQVVPVVPQASIETLDLFQVESFEELAGIANQTPDVFLDNLVANVSTDEVRNTLLSLGQSEEDIEAFLEPQPQSISDTVTEEGELVSRGFFANLWDSIRISAPTVLYNTKQYFVRVLPAEATKEVKAGDVKLISGMTEEQTRELGFVYTEEEARQSNELTKKWRDKFRAISAENQEKHEAWLEKNEDLQPPKQYRQDITQNWSLLKDTGYWGYTIGEAATYSLAILGTTLGVTFATKNPYLGVSAGVAIATPAVSADLFEDLVNSGAPEDRAANIAVPVGFFLAATEAIDDLPLLSAISPIFSPFKNKIRKEVTRRTVLTLIKKFGTTFGTIEAVEALQEVGQDAVQNAFVSIYDENRKIFEDVDETIIRTLIATSPLAIFGGGMAMRHVPANIAEQTPDKKGWEQDEHTGEWYKPQLMTETYEELYSSLLDSGMTDDQASLKALNELAQTSEGEQAIREVVKPIPEIELERLGKQRETLQGRERLGEDVADEIFKVDERIAELRGEPSIVGRAEVVPEVTKLTGGIWNTMTPIEREQLGLKANLDAETRGERWDGLFPQDKRALIREFKKEQLAKPTPPVTPEVPVVEAPTEAVEPIEVVPEAPVEGATKRVFDRIQIEPAEPNVIQKVKKGYNAFQVQMVDDLYNLKKTVDVLKKGGAELSIEEDPYVAARLLKGITGKVNTFLEQGTFGKKFWKIEKGKAVPNYTGESLESILREVRKPSDWQDFSTYMVANRTIGLSARDIVTGIAKDVYTEIPMLTRWKRIKSLLKQLSMNKRRSIRTSPP